MEQQNVYASFNALPLITDFGQMWSFWGDASQCDHDLTFHDGDGQIWIFWCFCVKTLTSPILVCLYSLTHKSVNSSCG